MSELFQIFGSKKHLAEAIGEHPSVISRWYNQLGGKIPHKYNTAILNAAHKLGLDLDEVGSYLQACCVCQTPWEAKFSVVRAKGKK
jgi:hypothetical protein